jgi:hypothetical protein
MTKVIEIVRSTSMPTSAAIFMSCSHARCARPIGVREISKENAVISAMVSRMMTICR